MKNSYLSIFCSLLVFFASCEKIDSSLDYDDSEQIEKDLSQEIESDKLVSFELKSSVPAKEAVSSLVTKLTNYEEIPTPLPDLSIEIDLEAIGIQFKTYRIQYKTVDINNNEIILSGDVCYIDAGITGERVLESVSLFHPAFATSERKACEYEQYAFPGRSIHNALVVYPHYQGYYYGRQYRITVCESLLKARQAIDCEIAALDLIKHLDNVRMMKGYYTENMGISCGTAPALATQYLLEQDPEMKEVNTKYINLYSTYCCEGAYSYSDLFWRLTEVAEYDEGLESFTSIEDVKPACVIALIVGTYDTWKGKTDEQGKPFFDGIDDVREFFDPTFLSTPLYDEIFNQQVTDVIECFRQGKMDAHSRMFKRAGFLASTMVAKDIINDESNEKWQALAHALAQNEVIKEGWTPKSLLCISHSRADEFVPVEQAITTYHNLSHYGLNPLVSLKLVNGLNHTEGNQFFTIIDLVLSKHPCSL